MKTGRRSITLRNIPEAVGLGSFRLYSNEQLPRAKKTGPQEDGYSVSEK